MLFQVLLDDAGYLNSDQQLCCHICTGKMALMSQKGFSSSLQPPGPAVQVSCVAGLIPDFAKLAEPNPANTELRHPYGCGCAHQLDLIRR